MKKEELIRDPAGATVEVLNIRNIHPHIHDHQLEIIYCIRGTVHIHTAHDFCFLKEGEIATCDTTDIRCIYSDEDNICVNVHVELQNSGFTEEDIRGTLFSCWNEIIKDWQRPYLEEMCNMVLSLAYEKCSDDNAETEARIVDNMIDHLMKYFSWFTITDDPENKLYENRLVRIVAYIDNHCADKITIAHIAELLYLSPAYISSFIRRTSFRSFTFLLNYYRCLKAQHYLVKTDYSVGEISELCGFSTPKYFYKYFRACWNDTPLQYRKRIRRLQAEPERSTRISTNRARGLIREHMARRMVAQSAEKKEL